MSDLTVFQIYKASNMYDRFVCKGGILHDDCILHFVLFLLHVLQVKIVMCRSSIQMKVYETKYLKKLNEKINTCINLTRTYNEM